MWNPNQNSYYDPSFKRNPIAINVRPRLPFFPNQVPPGPPQWHSDVQAPRPRFFATNQRILLELPNAKRDFYGGHRSPRSMERSFHNDTSTNFPVFATRSASPVFSSNIYDSRSDSSCIPSFRDCSSTKDAALESNKLDAPIVAPKTECDTHPAVDSGKNLPSSHDDIPTTESCNAGVLDQLKDDSITVAHTDEMNQNTQSNAELSVPNNISSKPSTNEVPSTTDSSLFPINITKVLGDAKMLSDILSVAKTIQFSEQSKSLSFPTCSSKSIAIVQPINVQTDATCSTASGAPTWSASAGHTYDKQSHKSPDAPIGISPPSFGPWANSKSSNSPRLPSEPPLQVKPKTDLPGVEVTAQDNFTNQAFSAPDYLQSVCLSASLPSSSSKASSSISTDIIQQHSHVDRTSKRSADGDDSPGRPDSLCKVPKTESHANVSLPICSSLEESLLTSVQTVSHSTFSHVGAEPAAPIEKPLDALKEEALSESDIKCALFSELGKCNITNNEEAETVLQVISSLTEAYLKYKLHFMPATKFQNLISAIREGKEKETNFVLGYLKCGSANRQVTPPPLLPTADDVTPPPIDSSAASPSAPSSSKERKTDPEPATATSAAEACATTIESTTSSYVPRLEPFVPRYTSSSAPVNYWMSSSMPGLPSAIGRVPQEPSSGPSYPPLQPPLPPPLLAPLRPPLPPMSPVQPPLPPQRLAPPPLPFADMPLPPPLPPD